MSWRQKRALAAQDEVLIQCNNIYSSALGSYMAHAVLPIDCGRRVKCLRMGTTNVGSWSKAMWQVLLKRSHGGENAILP